MAMEGKQEGGTKKLEERRKKSNPVRRLIGALASARYLTVLYSSVAPQHAGMLRRNRTTGVKLSRAFNRDRLVVYRW
jgi:hypothetical protein